MRRAIALFLGVVLLTGPTSLAVADDERSPRRMFVKAEQLRRADVCDVGQAGSELRPLTRALAWTFLDHLEKARQLRPLLPALSSLENLTKSQREDLVDCLENWRQAAETEQRILSEHPGSEVAYDLSKKRRLTPEELERGIARVEAYKSAETIANDVVDDAGDDTRPPGYNAEQKEALERLLDAQEKKHAPSGTSSEASQSGSQLTRAQMDAIRQQLASCWSPPVGAKDSNREVVIRAELSPNGTVQSARIQSRDNLDDSFYRALAESAMRALKICSPIKGLPAENYGAWNVLLLNFDPKEMLGG